MSLKDAGRRGILTEDLSAHGSVKLANFKCVKRKDRKHVGWVNELYDDLPEEFERLRSAGVKFMPAVLKTRALRLIEGSPDGSQFLKTCLQSDVLFHHMVTML